MAAISNFTTLPPELKAAVFTWIRTKLERAVVCLISRGWRDIMAPIVWKELTLDPKTISTTKLTTLMLPNSSILSHVRQLIADWESWWNEDLSHDFHAAVQVVIATIPKNRLLGSTSNMPFEPAYLLSLLRNQQRMRNLDIALDKPKISRFPIDFGITMHRSLATTALRGLTKLWVRIGSGDHTYRNSAYMIRCAPKLRDLSIDGDEDEEGNKASFDTLLTCEALGGLHADDIIVQQLQLSRFNLLYLDLATSHVDKAFVYIYFACLQSLSLYCCRNVEPFLTALATRQSLDPSLTEIDILMKGDVLESDIRAIEHLLRISSGVRTMWIDVGKARPVDISCITRHGSTLQHLGLNIDAENTASYYSVADLSTILKSAPGLTQLAVYISPIEMGWSGLLGTDFALDVLDGGDTSVPNALEAYLDCIARHRSLHTLQILSLPNIDYDMSPDPNSTLQNRQPIYNVTVPTASLMMQKLAAEVMCFLHKLNSHITLLGLCPLYNEFEQPKADHNGHKWPRYYYIRGRISDPTGRERFTAVPFDTDNLPDSSLLRRY
ncbi:hypothetical protein IG631_22314 [Alternaria alternata]|nr:hypothetical protein IG631_22314 [Alternaria alternata]